MEITLRETIKNTVANHLNNGFLAFGQCLTAVGWVGGTLPEMYEDQGMVELSMADVAGGAFVVGAGLMGKRPIYIIRYQGFNWYNSISIINYACKSKEIWGVSCPIFVRSIAMEGSIGPVAGSSHHSLYYRMPGVKIYSPMSSDEYKECYSDFMNSDDVFYVSEHRESYSNNTELKNIIFPDPDCILFPISVTRFAAMEASKILLEQGIKVSVYHQKILKPYLLDDQIMNYLNICGLGIVLDDDYEDGVSSNIAQKLMINSNAKVYTMGLKNRSAGFAKHLDNLPPSSKEICDFIKKIIKEKNG